MSRLWLAEGTNSAVLWKWCLSFSHVSFNTLEFPHISCKLEANSKDLIRFRFNVFGKDPSFPHRTTSWDSHCLVVHFSWYYSWSMGSHRSLIFPSQSSQRCRPQVSDTDAHFSHQLFPWGVQTGDYSFYRPFHFISWSFSVQTSFHQLGLFGFSKNSSYRSNYTLCNFSCLEFFCPVNGYEHWYIYFIDTHDINLEWFTTRSLHLAATLGLRGRAND